MYNWFLLCPFDENFEKIWLHISCVWNILNRILNIFEPIKSQRFYPIRTVIVPELLCRGIVNSQSEPWKSFSPNFNLMLTRWRSQPIKSKLEFWQPIRDENNLQSYFSSIPRKTSTKSWTLILVLFWRVEIRSGWKLSSHKSKWIFH